MQKEFTINVPDQLWVDKWTENKTQTLTYDGPETYYVIISNNETVTRWSDEPIEPVIGGPASEKLVEVDSATQPEIAYWMTTKGEIVEHLFRDVVNHDNSIYKEITNPSIHDYFYAVYDQVQDKILLKLITRKTLTFPEIKATERLAYVNLYNGVYGFSTEIQATIDQFVTETNAYLETMKDIYPWKYVTLDDSAVPKIPASLVTEFSKLPEPRRKM